MPVLGLGIVAGWAVTIAVVRSTVSRPLARITTATEALAGQDAAGLSDVLLAVAQGDLTNRLEPNAYRLAPSSATLPEIERLGEAVNVIADRLADGAAQLNSVTDESCRRLFYVGLDGYLQDSHWDVFRGPRLGPGTRSGSPLGLPGVGNGATDTGRSLGDIGHWYERHALPESWRSKWPGDSADDHAHCPARFAGRQR